MSEPNMDNAQPDTRNFDAGAQPAAPVAPAAPPQAQSPNPAPTEAPAQPQPQGNQPLMQHAPATPAASLHARLFDGILKNLSGGPIKVMQSDPTTGDTRLVEVPRSRSSMANSVLAGVLSSMFTGAQRRGAEPDYKPVMGSTGTQHAEDQAKAQDQIDQMQDRKMKVLKSNLETIQSQMAAARMGDEVMDKQIADGAQQVELARKYDEGRLSKDEPQAIQATNLTYRAAMDKIGNGQNGWIAVPSGRTSHLDPQTGKTISEPTYTIMDPHVKVKLSEDDVNAMAQINPSLADAYQRSGGNIELPLDVVNSARLVRAKVNNVQVALNQFASDPAIAKALGITGGKVGNLMTLAQDRTLRPAINNMEAQMAAHANGDRHYSILDAMLTADGGPALAQKLGINPQMANDWLDKQHNERLSNEALAKTTGDKAPADSAAIAQIPVLAKQMGLSDAEIATASAELPKTGATRADVAKVLENIRHQHDTNAQLAAGANRDSGDPAMIERVARSLVDNPASLTTMRDIGTRGTQRLAIIDKAEQIAKAEGKTFDTGLINQRVKFLEQYEDPKGKAAINRQAINNIMQHAADVSDLNQLNRRSNVKIVNTPVNALKDQFGDTTYTQYQTATGVLKDELGLYFAGGYSPTKDQQAMWEKIQADTATPAQTEAFAKEVVRLATRRADTFNQQFKTNMGYDDPNMLTPQAKSAAERLGLGDAVVQFKSGGQLGGPVVQNPQSPRMVSVQIPGQKPGAISADKINAFKKKYPNAIVGGQ